MLEEMRKLHEWTVFGQKEAEDEEKTEMEIDSEACNLMPDWPKEE